MQGPLASQNGVIFGRNANRANDEDEGAVEVIHLPAQPEAEATQKVSFFVHKIMAYRFYFGNSFFLHYSDILFLMK